MRIDIRGRGCIPSEALREHVEHGLLCELSRFAPYISKVLMEFSVAPLSDGRASEASLRIEGPRIKHLQLSEQNRYSFSAADRVIDRAARYFDREMARAKENRLVSA